MPTTDEIRQGFIDFFKERGHTFVPSASLIPEGDPTLLFTNAGMNQFKDVFLGEAKRDYKRAVNSQRCMRVSGKHNDLEEVGHDGSHHTFFEMLGNWSFGDYYKLEAIKWAWELLTEVWGLPKERLYATVYNDDDEAFNIWERETDIDNSHIMRFGKKDNFWEMGDTGPCGPCSEIHIDLGEEACNLKGTKHNCNINGECNRYIELWNLVFIQYNREADGSLIPLKSKHVDTGMGLERISAVLQGKNSNYLIDIFVPILNKIAEISGYNFEDNKTPFRVIADHIRALTFAISDNILPSNEGRGYVIRRILRRALRYGRHIGLKEPFLYKVADSVVDVMKGAYPYLLKKIDKTKEIIKIEEEKFFKTLAEGMYELEGIITKAKETNKKIISGEDIFRLYDSRGFPIDIIKEVAEDENISLDMEGFEALMNRQKEMGKASWKGEARYDILKDITPTQYTGEDTFDDKGSIIAIFDRNIKENIKEAKEGSEVVIVLDRTPFYGESGGQVGDTGIIEGDNLKIDVIDTKKINNIHLHICKIIKGSVKIDDKVMLKINKDRRLAITRHHSATHIIQAALRKVVGEHVMQSGSLVDDKRLRFDFSHYKGLDDNEIKEIENIANSIVLKNIKVEKLILKKEEAKQLGALAFFGEKYGEVVRVIKMGDYSIEFCGGSHVNRTGDIGLIKIVSQSAIASGVRRIEAICGLEALNMFQSLYKDMHTLAKSFNISIDNVKDKVITLLEDNKSLKKEIKKLKSSPNTVSTIEDKDIFEKDGIKYIAKIFDNIEPKTLPGLADNYRARGKTVVVFISKRDKGNSIIVSISKDLNINAMEIFNKIKSKYGGKGGGRKDLAQGVIESVPTERDIIDIISH